MEVSMENPSEFKERREYPRSLVDLPVEYRIMDLPHAHGGLVVNASEGGLLIHSVKDMPLGLKLNIVVMFLAGYELANFEVTAEIIWKDLHLYNRCEGYQYGLKIVQILEQDHWKLKQLLNSQFIIRGESFDHPPLDFRASLPE
jgi:PilZ domain